MSSDYYVFLKLGQDSLQKRRTRNWQGKK